VVVHESHMWSLVAGCLDVYAGFRGGENYKWPPLGFQKWRHGVYRCGSISSHAWLSHTFNIFSVNTAGVNKLKIVKLQITQLSRSSRYFLPLTALFWNAFRL